MPASDARLTHLILSARDGNEDAINRLLSEYRPFLRLIADQAIGQALQRREDASDIVQQTEIEAFRAIRQFQGGSEPEFSAWVKQILRRNVANLVRDNRAAKRDVRRERYLDEEHQSVSVTWIAPPDRRHPSPSHHVIKAEAALKLAAVLGDLPEAQQVAVRRRHIQGATLDEIATAMEKSPAAVAGLIRRGLQTLRDRMAANASCI